ncbi:MAG: hypothetical protein ACAI18_06645 [Gemmatimonadales bacterium]|jgi:hypothetical protein
MQHILNRWIRYVEATGHELAVTLLVGGTTISGYLTPRLRHDEWVKEILLRAVHEGGRSSIPAVEMEPITPEMAERVREEWGDREAVEEGEDFDDPIQGIGPGCVLRNAEVRPPGPAMHWHTYPYLHVQVSAVEAVFMAHTIGATLP